jgi:hypothetical protein
MISFFHTFPHPLALLAFCAIVLATLFFQRKVKETYQLAFSPEGENYGPLYLIAASVRRAESYKEGDISKREEA